MSDSVGVGVGVGTSGLLREAWSAIKERSLAWAFRARDRLAQSLDELAPLPSDEALVLVDQPAQPGVVLFSEPVGKDAPLLDAKLEPLLFHR